MEAQVTLDARSGDWGVNRKTEGRVADASAGNPAHSSKGLAGQ